MSPAQELFIVNAFKFSAHNFLTDGLYNAIVILYSIHIPITSNVIYTQLLLNTLFIDKLMVFI